MRLSVSSGGQIFHVALDRFQLGDDYRKLALVVMKAFVRALEDVLARDRGATIESPKLIEPVTNSAPPSGCGLRAAYAGWLKTQARKGANVVAAL